MQTETLVGLISGLGGAVIGFAGALGGAWIQQSYGAKAAKQQRMEQRALASGETAINELLQLGQLVEVAAVQRLPSEDWMGLAREHVRKAEVAISVIPNSGELRWRMTRLIFVMKTQLGDQDGSGTTKAYYMRGSREGVELIAAFLRGDELPDEENWVEVRYRERLEQFPAHSPSSQDRGVGRTNSDEPTASTG
ncbi:hypothetical protein [Streptomyces prasinus]|uniref:hypothetical protein n=1 Tax=Streptomyces prasinus TaxID=67345 RepID=UPI0033A9B0C5